jgi:hypothetical protein
MHRAISVALTAVLGGCILIVDPIETGDHCGIQGTTDCASCLRTSCQTPIDRCCANGECSGGRILGAMDACGRGDNASCADILAAPRIQKEEEALRSCASSACGARCRQGSTGTGADNRPKWTCSTSRDQNNVCSSCIYQKCVARVDSCCDDSFCREDTTIQSDMGACISGDVAGCAFILDADRSKAGQAGVLRKCIDESCSATCMGNRLPHTKCTLNGSGEYCTCTNAEISGTQKCDAVTLGGDADCTLGTDGCTCGEYTCSTDASGGCGCTFFGGVVSGTSCASTTGKACCVKRDGLGVRCECRFSTCSNSQSETELGSCSRADVMAWAAENGLQVDSCSR